MSGKRVDFTGRTVISPDPNCAIDEVVVPLLMAKVLTFSDTVNRYNIEHLRTLVRNGPDNHPGANFVEIQKSYSGDGPIKINLLYANKRKIADELAIGDVVERHISNDSQVFIEFLSWHTELKLCQAERSALMNVCALPIMLILTEMK